VAQLASLPFTLRLSSSTRLVRAWLVAGMVWYGFTRVVQTGLLIWLLITVDARLRPTTPFVIFVIVAAALSGVQAYTFKIYGVSRGSRGGTRCWFGTSQLGAHVRARAGWVA
jgi:hypothetical protein